MVLTDSKLYATLGSESHAIKHNAADESLPKEQSSLEYGAMKKPFIERHITCSVGLKNRRNQALSGLKPVYTAKLMVREVSMRYRRKQRSGGVLSKTPKMAHQRGVKQTFANTLPFDMRLWRLLEQMDPRHLLRRSLFFGQIYRRR